ncbi:fatty-acid amide hydrolase 2-like [Dermacentor variabilis]|uniref:fatty-acid amide hydrolase 2-like n=1 Tax=Dermacentor variabilis TaxID=34621 RepID=UPI003F5BC20E
MAAAVATVQLLLSELLMRVLDRISELLLFVANLTRRRQRVQGTRDPLLLAPAVVLADAIRHGRVTSEAVIRAYERRVLQVDPVINAVVDERFEAAVDEARAADELVRTSSPEELERTKPLLGVPFITKNSVMIKGLLVDAGLPAWRGDRAERDAEAVRLLREAGAIPVATTNTPELCLWTESFNKLYGRTHNPHDTRRTAGGSSGGEGSLLSAAGALLGIGTDIGGSIRIPSTYCGTFGHMTTPGILSYDGHRHPFNDEFMKLYSTGPMTRYACDLLAVLKVMLTPEQLARMQLDKKVDLSEIKVFYADDEGCSFFSRIHPDMREAVRKAARHLKEQCGSAVEPIKLEALSCGFEMWLSKFSASKCEPASRLFTNADGRRINPFVETLRILCGRSLHTFPAVVCTTIESVMPKPDSGYVRRYLAMARDFRERLLSSLGEDGVLICPAALGPAPFHNEHAMRPGHVSLTAPANVAGLPSTAVPTGLTSDGRPVGVQVVAAPYMDRLCLAVAAELEKAFGGWQAPFELACRNAKL